MSFSARLEEARGSNAQLMHWKVSIVILILIFGFDFASKYLGSTFILSCKRQVHYQSIFLVLCFSVKEEYSGETWTLWLGERF